MSAVSAVEELAKWRAKRLLPKFDDSNDEEEKIDELTHEISQVTFDPCGATACPAAPLCVRRAGAIFLPSSTFCGNGADR